MRLHRSAHSRSAGTRCAGHTLLELLVVLAVLGVCGTLGTWAIVGAIARTEARSSAQGWQAAVTAAQSRAVWGGVAVQVAVDREGLFLQAPASAVRAGSDALGPLSADPAVNVPRWRVGGGSAVTFAAGSGAPDSAGTLTFGGDTGGIAVVVRVETGLTRRVVP